MSKLNPTRQYQQYVLCLGLDGKPTGVIPVKTDNVSDDIKKLKNIEELTFPGGTKQIQAYIPFQIDWNQVDSTALDFIKNKPTVFSGSYNDLTDKPIIPPGQLAADWTQTDTTSLDYIRHKPSDLVQIGGIITGSGYLKRASDGTYSVVAIDDASATVSGVVNNTSLQELGGVDKLINGVRIGRGEGTFNTGNVVIGGGVLSNNTTGSENTGVGYSALNSNTTGSENTAFGRNALNGNTTGIKNTGIGKASLVNNTSGNNNTSIGVMAGWNNTTGSNNVNIGYNSEQSSATASNEITIGNSSNNKFRIPGIGFEFASNSLKFTDNTVQTTAAKQADWNQVTTTAIDFIKNKPNLTNLQAASATLTGVVNNTALQELGGVDKSINGIIIGKGGGNASENTVVSKSGMLNNTTGNNNTVVGAFAAANITTGSNNVAVGRSPLYSTTTGSNNVVVGNSSLNISSASSDTVAVGHNSLGSVTTGYDNLALGNYSGSNLTTGHNNILIGNNANGSSATVSNEITLGNTYNTKLRIPGIGFEFANNSLKFTDNTVQTTAAKQVDWTQSDNTKIDFIQNKPTLATVAISGSYNDLSDLPSVAPSQIQSDWNQTDNTLLDFIKNKPDLTALQAVSGTVSGIVNNTSLQELGGVDKKINGVRIGKGSGNVDSNVVLGNGALNSNTTGDYNTAIGDFALRNNTTGANNFALGSGSLYTNTSGTSNLAIGLTSLFKNTTGGQNISIGSNVLYNNTTGSDNTAAGSGSLFSNTTGYRNTVYGRSTMLSNTTGNHNVAVGYEALYSNTTGTQNTVIGAYAGTVLSTGVNNVVIGFGAEASDAAISNEITLGSGAITKLRIPGVGFEFASNSLKFTDGTVQTTAATAVVDASSTVTGLVNNTALQELGGQDKRINGLRIGRGSGNADSNTVLGFEALNDNTTGGFNIAIGYKAMNKTTTGIGNAAIGWSALAKNTTGEFNMAIGPNSLSKNTTGVDNVAVGQGALNQNTTGGANIAIGSNAGSTITTGMFNIVIGTGSSVTTGNTNIVIGGEASSATVSNEMTIGGTTHNKLRVPGIGFEFTSTAGIKFPDGTTQLTAAAPALGIFD